MRYYFSEFESAIVKHKLQYRLPDIYVVIFIVCGLFNEAMQVPVE
jgi:hypothetical protein